MKTRLQLAAFALWVFTADVIYGMGCYGQKLQAHYATLAKSWYYTSKNPTGFKRLTTAYQAGRNPWLYDCHGIVDGFRMDDLSTSVRELDSTDDISADAEMNRVKASGVLGVDYGPLATSPVDNRGYGYWLPGHFGVGVGNGEVVDIYSTGLRARKRPAAEGGWTNWLKCFGIDYNEEDDMIYCKLNDLESPATLTVQAGLIKLGIEMKNDAGKIYTAPGGAYQTATRNGVAIFKQKYGLPGTGDTFDGDCVTAMFKALAALPDPTPISQAQFDAVLARLNMAKTKAAEIAGI